MVPNTLRDKVLMTQHTWPSKVLSALCTCDSTHSSNFLTYLLAHGSYVPLQLGLQTLHNTTHSILHGTYELHIPGPTWSSWSHTVCYQPTYLPSHDSHDLIHVVPHDPHDLCLTTSTWSTWIQTPNSKWLSWLHTLCSTCSTSHTQPQDVHFFFAPTWPDGRCLSPPSFPSH